MQRLQLPAFRNARRLGARPRAAPDAAVPADSQDNDGSLDRWIADSYLYTTNGETIQLLHRD